MRRHLLAFCKVAKQRGNAPLIRANLTWLSFILFSISWTTKITKKISDHNFKQFIGNPSTQNLCDYFFPESIALISFHQSSITGFQLIRSDAGLTLKTSALRWLIYIMSPVDETKFYRSLINPYISYDLVAWGQAGNLHLKKIAISTEVCIPNNALFGFQNPQSSSLLVQ